MSMRDYAHASSIFRSNNYARAPKYKTAFYVKITLTQNNTELNYAVKSVELPKFEVDVQDVNQYNKKVIVQRQIKYTPISIKFHDDNTGTLRDFWQNYYNYYFDDGIHDDEDYNTSDIYSDNRTNSNWGFAGANSDPFIKNIEIYSMYQGQAQKITIEGPVISNFTHDTHDYTEGTGLMEASMTVHYTGVKYAYGQSSGDIPGFSDGNAYDTSGATSTGLGSEHGSTSLYPPTTTTNLDLQQQAYNRNYQVDSAITNGQINDIINTSYPLTNDSYVFPVITPDIVVNSNYGSTEISGDYAYSNNTTVRTLKRNPYGANSWQAVLYEKGYSQSQISAAELFVNSINLPAGTNIIEIAEIYIKNPKSSRLAKYGKTYFGQDRTRTSSINFSNPAAITQPIYNGLGWKEHLISLGYTQAEIANALKFISNLKVSPAADLTSIAINYINSSKQSGSISNTVVTNAVLNQRSSKLVGPNFNSTSSVSVKRLYNKI